MKNSLLENLCGSFIGKVIFHLFFLIFVIIQVDVSINNELSNAESNGKSSSTNEHDPAAGEDHTTAEKMRVMLQRKASRVNSQDLTGNHGRNQIFFCGI